MEGGNIIRYIGTSEYDYIITKIDNYRKTIESLEEKIDNDPDPPVPNEVIDYFTHINRERHDIFLLMIQSALNMELDTGDRNPKDQLLNELMERKNENLYYEYRNKFEQSPFKEFNKTPDIVHYTFENNSPVEMLILDVAVTRDPAKTIVTKFDKYRILTEMFHDLKPKLGVVLFDINEGVIRQRFMSEDRVDLGEMPTEELNKAIQKGEILKEKMKTKMDDKGLVELNTWLKNSKTEEDLGAEPFKDFDFKVSLREFREIIRNTKPLRRFFEQMSEENKELMVRSLYHTNPKLEDNAKIEEFAKKILNFNHDPEEMKKSGEYFLKMENDLLGEMMNYKSEKLPMQPNKEEMDEAFVTLGNKAEELYSKQKKPKLLSPLHLNFSKNSDFSKNEQGWVIKKRRMERVYKLLEKCNTDKNLVRALKLIFKPSQVEDKVYSEEFLKGNVYITENGGVITKEDFMKKVKNQQKDYRKLIARDEEKVTGFEHLTETSDLIAVSYKRGEVIAIRPQNMFEVKELLKTAGVGLKKPVEERDHIEKSKIKSLEFWSNIKLEEYNNEFIDRVEKFERMLTRIGNSLSGKNFMAFSSSSDSSNNSEEESEKSSSDEDELTWDERKENADFERGMQYFMRHHEILWENISYVSHLGGNGFRIVQGITDNSFVIIFPTESIMKGSTGVPFINVSIVSAQDEHESFNDKKERVLICGDHKIIVSGGRRIDRSRLTGYLGVKPSFYTAVSILNNYRSESRQDPLNRFEQSKLALIMHNININTSSLLDNVRYMTENTMADYSFCGDFIKEKFLVPVKNHVQAYLFKRSKDMLTSLRKEMQEVRVKKAIVSEDGEVNIDTSRVVTGSFSSFLESDIKYKKPEFLIGEIYTLYFSIPKGLHGDFHVLVDIHKTPVEIQNQINEMYGKDIPVAKGFPKSRFEFDPRMICVGALECDKNISSTYRNVRDQFERRERPHETPLRTKTTCSTKSTLVKDNSCMSILDGGKMDMEMNPMLSELNSDDFYKIQESMSKFEKVIKGKKRNETRNLIKKYRRDFKETMKFSTPQASLQANKFLEEKVSFNFETGSFEYRLNMAKNDYKWKLTQEVKNRHNKELEFYTSGVVVTEVLKDVLKEKDIKDVTEVDSLETLASKSKKSVTSPEKWVFAIRKKGQRTQKDREIFVVDLNCKYGLYIMEHFYKQMCIYLEEEKISEPGDMKIISMERQVRSSFAWMAREIKRMRENEPENKIKGEGFHFNLDMTKWAPKDNLFKFIYTISCSRVMTFEEKLYCMGCLGKLADKRMYLDEELHYRLMIGDDKEKVDTSGYENNPLKENPFRTMSKNWSTNKLKIIETWLQGQLNYLSSWVHAGCVLLWKKWMMKLNPDKKFRFNMNVHSDDEQSDIYVIMDEKIEEKDFVDSAWSQLEFIMKSSCIEISNKKSNISKMIKQFVSQYNIAGEQVYLWCKPIMASISGCPYTTLKDDISSLMSKVSEALSKGAPKTVASVVIDEMKLHLWNLYGIRTKKMTNKFSEFLGVQESKLPSCLGNAVVKDHSTLAIAGPKTQDQMVLAGLLKECGATTEKEATRKPKDNETMKALQIFYIMDLLTSETINEEEDISATISLNPFKPTRFKNKRTGILDPFNTVPQYRQSREEYVKSIKDSNPGLGLIKPRTPQDLMWYYMVIFNNTNFRASLAGQSPNILHLNKIVNRKRGVFRIKDTGNLNLNKFRDELDKDQFTCEEISNFLIKCMKMFTLDLRMINYLRMKFVVSDPEFRILQFTSSNARTTAAVIRKNPIPKKKPNSDEYSTIVNRINMLLCYFFDEDYFERNQFKIQYPTAVSNDLIKLNEMFPVEFGWLREQKRMVSNYNMIKKDTEPMKVDRWMNYEREVNILIRVESEQIKINRFVNLQDAYIKSEKGLTEIIFREEEILNKGGMASILENTMTLEEYKKKEEKEKEDKKEGSSTTKKQFDIFSRLVNNSKVIDMRTQKVVFCSPTQSNELHEIALAMKTVIESVGEIAIGYYLTANQKQELRNLRINMVKAAKSEAIEFIKQLSNVLKLAEKLKVQMPDVMDVINSAKLNDTDIGKIEEYFPELPRVYKRAAVYPLCLKNPEKASYYVSRLEPMTINWIKAQIPGDNSFIVKLHYENMIISMFGRNNTVQDIKIEVNGEIVLIFLNKALKMFCADLVYRDRNKSRLINLYEHFDMFVIDARVTEVKSFGYSSFKNEMVSGSDKMCTHYIRGLKIQRSRQPTTDRRVKRAVANPEKCEVVYTTEDTDKTTDYIPMKYFPENSVLDLNFKDFAFEGFRFEKLAKSRLFKAIMQGKLYDLTFNDAVKYYKDPQGLCSDFGTFGADYTYKLLTGHPEVKLDYNKIKEVFQGMKNYEVENRLGRERRPARVTKGVRRKIFGEEDPVINMSHDNMLDYFTDKFDSEDLEDHMNKFESNRKDMTKILEIKEESWNLLMKYMNDLDLRSVSKAITYMMSEKIIEEERFKDDETTYDQQMNDMIFIKEKAMESIKMTEDTGKLIEKLIIESQMYNFSKSDVEVFTSMTHAIHTIIRLDRDSDNFLSLLFKHNGTSKTKRTLLTSLAICCFLMGDKLIRRIHMLKNDFDEPETMIDTARNFYKRNKQKMSEYMIIVFDNFLRIWDMYMEDVRFKKSKEMMAVDLGSRASRKEKKKEKVKGLDQSQTSLEDRKLPLSSAFRKTKKENPELYAYSRDDIDEAEKFAKESKDHGEDTAVSSSTSYSESDTSYSLRKQKSQKGETLLDIAIKAARVDRTVTIEMEDILAMQAEMGDGEEEDDIFNLDDFE